MSPVKKKRAAAKKMRPAGTPEKKAAEARKPAKKKPAAQSKPTVKKPAGKAAARTATHTATTPRKEAAKLSAPRSVPIESPHRESGRILMLKKLLLEKKAFILNEAKSEIAKYVSGENRQLVETAFDEGDLAVIDISEDINLRRLSVHRRLLVDIDEALRKIGDGTYGICEECGEEISEKRIAVLPTATFCVDCQEHRERLEAIAQSGEL